MLIPTSRDYVDRTKLILVAFVANLGSLLFGYDFGATSTLLIDIDYFANSDSYTSDVYFTYANGSSGITGLIASGASIGATIAYIFLLFLGNTISKKDEILLAAFLYFTGALFESFSFYVSWKSSAGLIVLIIGRLIYGTAVATSLHSIPQYVAEMAPKELRGQIGSTTEAMVITGVCLGYFIGYVSSDDVGWFFIYLIGYLIALLMGGLALMTPHTPLWMARFNHSNDEILESLKFIFPNADLQSVEHLRQICEMEKFEKLRLENEWRNEYLASSNANDIANNFWVNIPPELKFLLFDPELRRCLGFAIVLVICSNCTGQAVLLYYIGDIFDAISPNNTEIWILGIGIAKLLPALLMTVFADSFRRRHLLLTGTVVMISGLLILCIGLYLNNTISSLIGIYSAVVGYEVGFGTMMWILLNEIFPTFVRSAANSIAVACLFTVSTIITFSLSYFEKLAGILGIFVFFTVMSIISLAILFLVAPETRGADSETAYKLVSSRIVKVFIYFGCNLDKNVKSNEITGLSLSTDLSNDMVEDKDTNYQTFEDNDKSTRESSPLLTYI